MRPGRLCLHWFNTSYELFYLRFDSIRHRRGCVHQIPSPGLCHIEAEPLGIYKGVEGSSVADVDRHVTKTFHCHCHICGKSNFVCPSLFNQKKKNPWE